MKYIALNHEGVGIPTEWSRPEMEKDRSDFWYFAFQVNFVPESDFQAWPNERRMLGIKRSQNWFIVRGERDWTIDPDDDAALTAFCDDFYEFTQGDLRSTQPRPFGLAAGTTRITTTQASVRQ